MDYFFNVMTKLADTHKPGGIIYEVLLRVLSHEIFL